jgi:hypothetical protein
MLEYYSAPHLQAQSAASVAAFASARGKKIDSIAQSPEALLRQKQPGPAAHSSNFNKMKLLQARR